MTKQLNLGDRVCFARDFLRNTGQFTGWKPFAEGEIVEMHVLGGGKFLVTVAWDQERALRLSGELPPEGSNILNVNLIRADRKHLEPA